MNVSVRWHSFQNHAVVISRIDSILQNCIHFPTGMLWFLKSYSKTIRFCRETKNKIKQHKKNILKVLGMGGIGTNQQKHRENQKKTIFQRSWGWGGLAQSKKNIEKTKKNNIPEVLGMGGSHQEFPNIVFLVFSMFFDFSPWSPPQRDSTYFFLCYHYMEVYTDVFSVYGIKWWTDNLKSRQVERVLTKFKGCEPSCRKVQKVAALVGSGGGDHIYIHMERMRDYRHIWREWETIDTYGENERL